MKSLFPLVAGAAGIIFATAVYAVDAKPAAPAVVAQPAAATSEAPAAPALTELELLETWGWLLSQNIGLQNLELSPEQIQALIAGLTRGASGGELGRDIQQVGPQLQQFLSGKQQMVIGKMKVENKKAEDAFFAELKKNPAVKETPSGLRYEIFDEGKGEKPMPTSTVKVHYTGRLLNGQVFDSSVQRGEPAEFPLNRVIPGWTEGLQLLAPGGKAKLYIPAALGYGDNGTRGIPPGSTLVFEVELLEVINAPAAEAAPALTPEAAK